MKFKVVSNLNEDQQDAQFLKCNSWSRRPRQGPILDRRNNNKNKTIDVTDCAIEHGTVGM